MGTNLLCSNPPVKQVRAGYTVLELFSTVILENEVIYNSVQNPLVSLLSQFYVFSFDHLVDLRLER